jgi:hypothetical protein
LSRTELALIIVIAGAAAAWFIGHRVGLGRSLALMFLTGVFSVLIVPHVPHSPIACVLSKSAHPCSSGHQLDWLMALVFIVPLGVGILTKNWGQKPARG